MYGGCLLLDHGLLITHKNCAVFIVFSFKQVGREAIGKSIASSELKLNIKRVRDC